MKRLTIGGLAAGCVGLGIYIQAAKTEPRPEAVPDAAAVVAAPPAATPAPAVLSEVVEVADLDPLLDPQVRPAGGVAFDPEPAAAVAAPAATPAPIPPAVD